MRSSRNLDMINYSHGHITDSIPVDQNDDDDDCSMLDYSIESEALTEKPEAEQLSISQREVCFGTVSVWRWYGAKSADIKHR